MKHVKMRTRRTPIFIISIVLIALFSLSFQQKIENYKYDDPGFLLDFNKVTDSNLSPDQKYRMIVLFQHPWDATQFITQNTIDIVILKRFRLIPALLILATPLQAELINEIQSVTGIWLDQRIHYLLEPQVDSIKTPEGSTELSTSNAINFNLSGIHAEFNGSNIIVAVLDTGIDPTHPDLDDLDDNDTTNESKIINGVSFVEMEPYYLGDFHGHGTFIAGVIAGTGNASGGVVKGVAPGAMLMNVKVLTSTGEGYWSWIISGIEYAVTHGADVIAMCFSGPGTPGDPVCRAIDAAVEKGIVVVTAAGDDGPSYSSIGSPGMAYSAISVGNYNQITGLVAQNSSRGPVIDFRTGPDLVAPGVQIISCRINTTDNPLQYIVQDFGTPVNESYTNASGSFSAAAYVAGATALFLQAFKLIDPISLKLIILKNAYDLGANPNAQGLGVININSTFNYLNQTYGEDPLLSDRLYTPPLPYLGFLGTSNLTLLEIFLNRTIVINCSVGSYADFGILTYYNNATDFNTTHFLLGRFGIKYNTEDMKWFSDMRVLREMHYVLRGFYDRSVSIITDETLLYTIIVESWDFINSSNGKNTLRNITGFKISIIINNLLDSPVTNISLFNWWKMDLFFNETDYEEDDSGVYNNSDDIIYANDTYESTNNAAYIGFKATIPTTACEVDTNSKTYDDVVDDALKPPNFQYFPVGEVGLASKWELGNLNPNENKIFQGALGIGESYGEIKNQIEWILFNTSAINVTDLVVCDFNTSISRMSEVGNTIHTDILIMNVGTLSIDNVTTKFTFNSSNSDYSQTFTNISLSPFQMQSYSADIAPLTTGIYNLSWYSINTTNEDIPSNLTYDEAAKRDTQPLDNIIGRNMFIYQRMPLDLDNGTLIFPSNLIFEPLSVQMPGDTIKYNLSILSTTNIDNISFQINGNASDYITVSPDSIINPNTYSFFEIEINIPIFIEPGVYNATITVLINASFSKFIQINFNMTNYTQIKGRVLFDTSHGSIESLQDWGERLDSIYARYFEFYKLATENYYNVDELPYGAAITSDILSYYDTVIICDPERGYNATEVVAYQNYVNSGGSIMVLAENAEECNISSLNSIINGYDLNITEDLTTGILYNNLTTASHVISQNIEAIELYDSVNVSTAGQAQLLTNQIALTNSSDDTNSKILLVGDSDLFMGSNLQSQNNSQFALNCLQWLMSNTVLMQVDIYSNYSSDTIYLGEKIHISINILVPNGSKPVSSEAKLAAAIIFPNGSIYYNYFSFYLRDGWHNMFFFTDMANQTGWYSLIIFVKHAAGTSLYNNSIPKFYVNVSQAAGPPGEELQPPSGPIFPPLVGFAIIWSILTVISLVWVWNQRKLKKKIQKVS